MDRAEVELRARAALGPGAYVEEHDGLCEVGVVEDGRRRSIVFGSSWDEIAAVAAFPEAPPPPPGMLRKSEQLEALRLKVCGALRSLAAEAPVMAASVEEYEALFAEVAKYKTVDAHLADRLTRVATRLGQDALQAPGMVDKLHRVFDTFHSDMMAVVFGVSP